MIARYWSILIVSTTLLGGCSPDQRRNNLVQGQWIFAQHSVVDAYGITHPSTDFSGEVNWSFHEENAGEMATKYQFSNDLDSAQINKTWVVVWTEKRKQKAVSDSNEAQLEIERNTQKDLLIRWKNPERTEMWVLKRKN